MSFYSNSAYRHPLQMNAIPLKASEKEGTTAIILQTNYQNEKTTIKFIVIFKIQ